MGNWWLAASLQCSPLRYHISCRGFGEPSNHPDDSRSLQPRIGALWLVAFPKTTITFERVEISDEIQENITGQLMEIGRTVWGPYSHRCPLWRGLRCHCPITMFLVSSSINTSIFHITWLNTFWTDLVLYVLQGRWSLLHHSTLPL